MTRDPRARAAAIVLVLLHAVLAWMFWSAQELPRGFRDEFFIVELATDIAFGGDLRALFLGDYYPPLLRLPGVLALWAGGSYRAMLAAQALLWLPLLALGTWWAARRLTGEWGATLAVALLLPAAGILDALHRFEPNLGATAAAAGCLAAFLWSDGLAKRREVLLLAGCLALGLMVDRLGTLPCVALPIAWAAWRGRGDAAVRRNVLVFAGALLVAVGWWYVIFVKDYVAEWVPQLLQGEVDRSGEVLEERPPLFFWLTHYVLIMLDSQVGLVGGLLFIAGIAHATTKRADEYVRSTLFWLAAGLLLFTLIPKRQPFYTLPLLPAAAVLAAAMLARWKRAAVAAALLVTLPAVFTANQGEDLDPGVRAWALHHRSPLPEEWVGERFPLGQRPDERLVDVEQLAGALDGIGIAKEAPVAVLSMDGQISESQLLSRLRMERRSADIYGITVHPEAIAERGSTMAALVDLRQEPTAFPTSADVITAYEQRFGWEDDRRLLASMRRMRGRMLPAGPGTPVGGSVLRVWAVPPGVETVD